VAVPIEKNTFTIGEAAPSLFGRSDLARYFAAASTMRNAFVRYTGGSSSRAGTKFVGFSKQTGRNYPPRLIPFQFSINQGLALEFGNFYMRVIAQGAFVTETPVLITNLTQASPAVMTVSTMGVTAATAITTGVLSSYAPGDTITIGGGTYLSPAILGVTNTKLLSLQVNSPGTGVYAPGNTIALNGGTQTTPAQLTVATTKVVSATIAAGGAGGANGTQTVVGTTGTGTPFQASVTVAGGAITAVLSITVAGSYTVNPTTPAAEPVTGAGLIGAQLNLSLGVATFTITNAGVFTANPSGATFTQASSSGSGTAATFQFALMGPNVVSVISAGAYSAFPANPASQLSTSGTGAGATFTLSQSLVVPFMEGDWIELSDILGMAQMNGQTVVVGAPTGSSFPLYDVYGNPIDSTTYGVYILGGEAARIYTIGSPYAEQDLEYMKWTQSADVMSICCVNQQSGAEYAPEDLSRNSNTDWTFEEVDPSPSVDAPATVSGAATAAGNVNYQYRVTSVAPEDGSESLPSPIASVPSAVDIATTAGSITLTWSAVSGVTQYIVYKVAPGYGVVPVAGAQFGFAGFAFGTQFVDSNIVPDFNQVPPVFQNPFARGQVLTVTPVAGGAGYTTTAFAITTSTGSGAVLRGVLVGGSLTAVIVDQGGSGYAPTDVVVVTGDGAGATATLQIGAQSGTYPGVPAYIQQRRFYGYSFNNPDSYWISQPGAYTNFDVRIPPIESDAISGTPWSVAVNGIQAAVPMPGGLVVLTGQGGWQLTGTGGSSFNPQPIGPATQQVQPQAYNGCHDHIPPIKIDSDIIFVQAKGSIYRNFSYQYNNNIYTGADLTLNSSHLFTGYQMREHAWCEEPFKVLWVVREDGTMLSLTYVKPQEVAGWARHDTNGIFQSVCSITEPPVDALYMATQRYPGDNTAYMIERMDNRQWLTIEDCWCVDAGLSLPQPEPDAILSASSARGLGAITGTTSLVGGSGYSAGTTAVVVDDEGNGPGTGAVPVLTIAGGAITAVTFAPGSQGTGYINPRLVITDTAYSEGGSGAEAVLALDNTVTLEATGAVFQASDEGSVIRGGGGRVTITNYVDAMTVEGIVTSPFTQLVPNSGGRVQLMPSGQWTMTAPVSMVSGLQHLAGMEVTGLADGEVIPPTTVSAAGSITLATPASAIVIGLSYGVQIQTIYLEGGEPTIQGMRKKIAAVNALVENSRVFQVGSNQPDGSTLSPIQTAPEWENLDTAPEKSIPPYGSITLPLYTGWLRCPVQGGFDVGGQMAIQQLEPLPVNILSLVAEAWPGDLPQNKEPQRAGK